MIIRILAQKARLASLALYVSILPVAAETRPDALPDLRIAKGVKNIKEAWLADATTRYRHFVLGAPYEAASVVVRTVDDRTIKLILPETSVFEDRQPRLADLDGDGSDEIVLVRSQVGRGAALAVVGLVGDRLKILAETPPTGHQNTWINPAGIADFDGDGILDIAYVQMPHVLGRLRIWTIRLGKLVEIATLQDTSNHVAGSRDIGLAVVADFDGDGVFDLAFALARSPVAALHHGERWDPRIGARAFAGPSGRRFPAGDPCRQAGGCRWAWRRTNLSRVLSMTEARGVNANGRNHRRWRS